MSYFINIQSLAFTAEGNVLPLMTYLGVPLSLRTNLLHMSSGDKSKANVFT